MIVGHSKVAAKIKVGKHIRNMGLSTAIEVGIDRDRIDLYKRLKISTPDWIACCYAMPHTDGSFAGDMFLNLSLGPSGTHILGDAIYGPGSVLQRGDFFIVNPLVTHWMYGGRMSETTMRKPWYGLQWVLPRRTFRKEAKKILDAFETKQPHYVNDFGRIVDDRRYIWLSSALPQ